MKTNNVQFIGFFFLTFFIFSCGAGEGSGETGRDAISTEDASEEVMEAADSASLDEEGGSEDENLNQEEIAVDAGLITAGEWNDLENWDFWQDVQNTESFSECNEYWDIYTKKRITVLVENDNGPVADAEVNLIKKDKVIWTARTDNVGSAELWIGLFDQQNNTQANDLFIQVSGHSKVSEVKLFDEGVNTIKVNSNTRKSNRIELSFIVDATGSMGDELEFLKADLESVIDSVEQGDASLNVFTSTVFYRDEGDDYVVKASDFTNDFKKTKKFINKQSADGGGDYPEAVHTALHTGINELQWSSNARTRIAFLLLDAPPHYNSEVVKSLHKSIKDAAAKGIKIIPITASGIDKNTEYLMRAMSIATNGTYVFITDDSGIGYEHLEPTVGEFEVEFLNNLMIRLIQKYSE